MTDTRGSIFILVDGAVQVLLLLGPTDPDENFTHKRPSNMLDIGAYGCVGLKMTYGQAHCYIELQKVTGMNKQMEEYCFCSYLTHYTGSKIRLHIMHYNICTLFLCGALVMHGKHHFAQKSSAFLTACHRAEWIISWLTDSNRHRRFPAPRLVPPDLSGRLAAFLHHISQCTWTEYVILHWDADQ